MAALNFPDHDLVTRYTNPDTGITYEWINNSWKSVRTAQTAPELFVDAAGDNLTGNLTLGTDKIVLDATTGAATFASTVDAAAFTVNGTALSSTIVSSTRPEPANYDAGTMWWNSDSTDTSLYVLYQDPTGPNGDPGGKYWVEAAPAPDSIGFSGSHTGDSTFTGNMNVTGTVDAGLVNVDRVNVVNTTETGSDIVHTINSGSSLITTQRSKADGSLQIGSIDGNSDTANIELNADGSATFAGPQTLGIPSSPATNGYTSHIDNTEASTAACFSAKNFNAHGINFLGVDGGNGNAITCKIMNDGSATFAGQVTTELAFVSRGNDSVNYLFQGQNGSGSEVCNIKNDGSATFAGTVDANALTVNGAAVDTSAQVDAKIAAIPPTDLSAYDTSAEVTAKVAALETSLTDGAPGALDTLNELAASLGDDSNFAGTVTNSLAGKADLSGATFAGAVSSNSSFRSSLTDNSSDQFYWNQAQHEGAAIGPGYLTVGRKGDSGLIVNWITKPDDGSYTEIMSRWVVDGGTDVISFTKDGNATFAGRLRADALSTSDGVILYTGVKPANRSNNYGFAVTSSVNGDLVAGIAADGSAEFAGAIKVGDNAPTPGEYGVKIYPNGGISVSKAASSVATVFTATDENGTNRSVIYSDGNATFAGNVLAGDISVTVDNKNGSEIGSNGVLTLQRQSSVGSGNAIQIFQGTGAQPTVKIGADGSATFAGDVDFGEWKVSNNSLDGARIYSVGAVQVNRTSGGGAVLAGRLNGTVTSQITADGSATLGESSTLTNDYVKILQNDRVIDAYQENTSGTLFVGASKNPDGTISNKFEVLSTGAASFAGAQTLGTASSPATNGYTSHVDNTEASTAACFSANNHNAHGINFLGVDGGNGNAITCKIMNDGTATFNGSIESKNNFFVNAIADAQVCFRTIRNGVNTALINGNGSAEFADNVSVDKYLTVTNSALSSDARVQIQGDQDVAISVYPTTAGARTIELKHDGSAEFADIVKGGAFHITDSKFTSEADELIRIIKSGERRFIVRQNGSATFASDITVSSTNADSNSATSSKLAFGLSNVPQTAYLQTSAGGSGGPGGFGANLNFYVKGDAANPFVKALELNYLGNATFAGGVNANYFSALTDSGSFNFYRSKGAAGDLNSAWGVENGTQTIQFYNNGSATFAGSITQDGPWGSNTDALLLDSTGIGIISTTGTTAFNVYNGSYSDRTVAIDFDGSATFAGGVNAGTTENRLGSAWGYQVYGGPNSSGFALYNSGLHTTNSAQYVVRCNVGGVGDTVDIRTDGSATFAGSITAAGYDLSNLQELV